MLFGSGKNGKSTLLNLLISFLGEGNTSNVSLQELCYGKFSRIRLFGKQANIHDDLPNTKLSQTGNFKMLTGESKTEGEMKFRQDTIRFNNYAKLIFSCNELPKTEDTTYAFSDDGFY